MSENIPIYQNASLYVGDLDPDITEAQLYEKFITCGPIVLAKICRDKVTRQSLGYAYVNFSQPADAERALDTLNFELLNSKPMRIMWSNRDPALRKSGVGNVFIKNLDKSIDNKSLYDTFATFGNIISCKIMCDENDSKGYGFVHFETQEAAEKAIQSVNNMLINGKKVYVGYFLSKQLRASAAAEASKVFTNVFVKNFDESIDDQNLHEMFTKYGDITSAKVARSPDGKHLGFGFVNFRDPQSAQAAVEQMNEIQLNEKTLFVGRFQKKVERINELSKKLEERKLEKIKKYQGVNLFIKNLDDKIDDDQLAKDFAAFGTITSAKVMIENGRSKGFGFVCFSTPEEATRAMAQMNGRIIGTKPLYVALAQRKDDRKKIIASQFRERMQNQQFIAYYPIQNGGAVGAVPAMQPRYFAPSGLVQNFGAGAAAGIRGPAIPRWQLANFQRPVQGDSALYGQQQGYYPQQQQQQQQPFSSSVDFAKRGVRPQVNSFVRTPYTGPQKPAGGLYGPKIPNSQPYSNNPAYQQQFTHKVQAGVPPRQKLPQQPNTAVQQAINVPGQEPLTISELSAAQPLQQKQMLGERLYPLIYQLNQEHVGKITGMLLEIDNSELLHMIDSPDALKAKVEEALAVLQSHKLQQQQKQLA